MVFKTFQAFDSVTLEKMINDWLAVTPIGLDRFHFEYAVTPKSEYVKEYSVAIFYVRAG